MLLLSVPRLGVSVVLATTTSSVVVRLGSRRQVVSFGHATMATSVCGDGKWWRDRCGMKNDDGERCGDVEPCGESLWNGTTMIDVVPWRRKGERGWCGSRATVGCGNATAATGEVYEESCKNRVLRLTSWEFPADVFASKLFGFYFEPPSFGQFGCFVHARFALFVFAELVPDNASVDATNAFCEWPYLLVRFGAWL